MSKLLKTLKKLGSPFIQNVVVYSFCACGLIWAFGDRGYLSVDTVGLVSGATILFNAYREIQNKIAESLEKIEADMISRVDTLESRWKDTDYSQQVEIAEIRGMLRVIDKGRYSDDVESSCTIIPRL